MYHSFFIHASVDGQLGCFHVLTIVNSDAMNIGVHVSFSILVSSGYMLSSGIAGFCSGFILSFFKIYFYILAVVSLHCCMWLSLVATEGGYSSLQYVGFSLWWLLLFQSRDSSCGLQ